MFDGLVDLLFGWVFDLMYILQKSICVVIDFVVDTFYKLSGIDSVSIDGKDCRHAGQCCGRISSAV